VKEILEYILLFAIVMGYIIIGYYLTRFIGKEVISITPYIQLLILSFSYAMIFGIAILSAGYGDPGFALPFPVIISGILTILWGYSVKLFITNFIIPLLFWWCLIFIVMLIRYKISRKPKNDWLEKLKQQQLHNKSGTNG